MLKTGLLLAAITAMFLAAGYALGGENGMVMALVLALATNFISYWYSDKIVLSIYRAKPLSPDHSSSLYSIIRHLSQQAGIPVPKAYLIESPQPNAFATGRSPAHAAIAVTTGLLSLLDKREVAAVIAHELSHVKNRDTLIMTVTAALAGAIGWLANFAFFFGGNRNHRSNPIVALLVMILAPLAAMLVQMAISRTREYAADSTGAHVSGDPLALASALEKISSAAKRLPMEAAERNPATAHLFIVNPLHEFRIDQLFSTHPPAEHRIQILRQMAARQPMHSPPQTHIDRRGSFHFG